MRYAPRTLSTLTLLAVVLLSALVLTGCPKSPPGEEKLTPERQSELRVERVSAGMLFTVNRIEGGIPLARTLRESGKLDPAFNLRMARTALGINTGIAKAADVALSDDPQALDALGLVSAALDTAKELEDEQVINLKAKGDTAKLVFDLGIIEGKNQLVRLRDELKDVPSGVSLSISPKARTDLERVRVVAARNKTALAEAIGRLSK